MMLHKPGKETDAPPSEGEIAEMGAMIQKLASEGVLLATDGLQSSSKGARVRFAEDKSKFSVTDGAFTESKGLVEGFAIDEAESRAEAIELAKRFLRVVGEGESEIRLRYDIPAHPPAGEAAVSARLAQ